MKININRLDMGLEGFEIIVLLLLDLYDYDISNRPFLIRIGCSIRLLIIFSKTAFGKSLQTSHHHTSRRYYIHGLEDHY